VLKPANEMTFASYGSVEEALQYHQLVGH